ncbi:unnamed protein product [marine sediment metagenome]|uniref:Uncharacterized protein n=1 Tax=marine sediment metagenome TaxID=412755 RepID=X0RL45_9ZZZZ
MRLNDMASWLSIRDRLRDVIRESLDQYAKLDGDNETVANLEGVWFRNAGDTSYMLPWDDLSARARKKAIRWPWLPNKPKHALTQLAETLLDKKPYCRGVGDFPQD